MEGSARLKLILLVASVLLVRRSWPQSTSEGPFPSQLEDLGITMEVRSIYSAGTSQTFLDSFKTVPINWSACIFATEMGFAETEAPPSDCNLDSYAWNGNMNVLRFSHESCES